MDLAIEICQGLEFARTHAVVQRDIKPANIFITDTGTVKLLDFGLARLVTSELTHSNMMMGTINYMAPEQVRGERADHRSDIFATGAVLYELLSGRKAFQAESFAATLYQILQEVPEPLDRIDSALPFQMVAIVERALAKPRDERYQQMSEMLRDLLTVRQQLQMSESPTGYRSAFSTGPLSPLPLPLSGAGSGVQRQGSGAQRPGSGAQRPSSGGVSSGDTDLTGVPSPLPMPLVTPMPTPTPAGTPVAPAAGRSRRLVIAALLAGVAVIGATTYHLLTRTQPVAPTQPPAPVAATQEDPAIQALLKESLSAFQSGDYAGAVRLADRVLLQAPNHPDARRIADRAREAADTIERGLRDARTLFAAGRYDDAAAAAGSVLSASPSNADAKQIMADSAARSRGRAVEDARARMTQARSGAIAAAAPTLAASSYGAAVAAEREAARLQKAGRAEAAAKYDEAGGLFRSAEVAAHSAAATASQRAAQNTKPTVPAAPPPAVPTPEVLTTPPVSSVPVPPIERAPVPAPVPPPPVVTPPSPTSPAPTAPPPAAQPPPSAPASAQSQEGAIRELLTRYELALESRSLEALKRIWPSLGGAQQSAIRNEFQHASRIDVDLVDPHISVNGAAATVTFVRHYELLTVDRQIRRADTPTTMTLRRTDSGWVIDQIRFTAAR